MTKKPLADGWRFFLFNNITRFFLQRPVISSIEIRKATTLNGLLIAHEYPKFSHFYRFTQRHRTKTIIKNFIATEVVLEPTVSIPDLPKDAEKALRLPTDEVISSHFKLIQVKVTMKANVAERIPERADNELDV